MIKNYLCAIVPFLKLCFYIFTNKKENIWLISERGNEARDNGYFLYNYIKNQRKDIRVKYIISKDSPDYNKICKDDVVIYRSKEHYKYVAKSKYLISTHLVGFSPNTMAYLLIRKLNLNKKSKVISLKHGITKDYIPRLHVKKNNFDLVISASKIEYDYMKKVYEYAEHQIKYTGFARFDTLGNSQSKNQILIMPTWRRFLSNIKTDEEFKKTEFYEKYNSLLNNEKLCCYLKEKNINVIFYPHYEMQKFVNCFEVKNSNVIIASINSYDVQDLLNKSKLLVTDYSSVFFDFGYTLKPCIYYHFDYDKYRKIHYSEGYFSYKNDGFGEILEDEKELVNKIIYYVDNNFMVEKEFEKRIKKFFPIIDNNNCKRIVNEIEKL